MSPKRSKDLALIEDEIEEVVTPESISVQITERTERMARLTQEAVDLAGEAVTPDTGTALVPMDKTPSQAKAQLAKLRADAFRRTESLQAKQDEIRAVQSEIENLMREQLALAEETLGPIQKYVARLEEGIGMVNLYLGREEEIITLATGEPAPADEPVAIRQMVLMMDEECAINPDEGGIDATNIEAFDAWLLASPAHVDQVLPERKGVVALRPRRDSKRYEDPWKSQAVADADKQTYFLIRNGENLYRTWTEFKAGDRLVPLADEFGSFFYEEHRSWDRGKPKHRIPIKPGTPAWDRADEKADARKRHYMRVALILQGLVDRTTVFHPLPEGGVNFMDYEQVNRRWRFITDMESAIGTGRKPFYEWMRETNAQLRVGMRIVGSFSRYYRREDDPYHGRIWPRGAERPPSKTLLVIEGEEADGFVVRYPRTAKIWKRQWIETRPGWGYHGETQVESRQRASCVLDASENNYIAFDLVTEAECVTYLNSRLDRHAYADMFPVLKAVIRAKRNERAEEAPFREMLAGVLARDNGVTVAEAVESLDSLIAWWKLTNRNHRPLVGDEKAQAKAVRMIVAEHARRLKAERKGISGGMVNNLRAKHPKALLIGRKRDGKYVVYEPHGDGPFVARITFGVRSLDGRREEWKLLRKAQVAALTIGYTSPAFEKWDLNAKLSDHLTGPEFDQCVAEIRGRTGQSLVAIAYDPKKRRFYSWQYVGPAKLDDEHPISGEHKSVEVRERAHEWERKGQDAILKSDYGSHRSRYSNQRKPWDTRAARGKGHYDRELVNKYVVAYHNPELDEMVEAEKARYGQIQERRRKLTHEARLWVGTVETEWVKRREAQEYERFLADFMDPTLWEGHRKTLPRETFEYPYSHWRSWGDETDSLALTVEHAVEEGEDLDGLTVAEAVERFFPDEAWLRRRLRWHDSMHHRDLPTPEGVEDDLLDLRFSRPEPDEDDDE